MKINQSLSVSLSYFYYYFYLYFHHYPLRWTSSSTHHVMSYDQQPPSSSSSSPASLSTAVSLHTSLCFPSNHDHSTIIIIGYLPHCRLPLSRLPLSRLPHYICYYFLSMCAWLFVSLRIMYECIYVCIHTCIIVFITTATTYMTGLSQAER